MLNLPLEKQTQTPLTDEQVREAEAAFLRLGDKPRSLSFYVDFALTNYKEPESQKSLPDAIADYIAAKSHECEQGHICRAQLKRTEWDPKRFSCN